MRTEDSRNDEQTPGKRARLGALLHRSGMLGPAQVIRSLLRREMRILAYHRVLTLPDANAFDFDLELVSASAAAFRAQMSLLKQHFRPMRLGDMVAAIIAGQTLPSNAVAVTFDDGYDDNFLVAYPILRELQVPATFFVSTGYIDSGLPYDYDWLVHMILGTTLERISMPELNLELHTPSTRLERRWVAGEVLNRIKQLDGTGQSALMNRLQHDWQMPCERAHPDCRPMNWQQLREMQAAGFEIGSHGVHHRMLAKLDQAELEFELRESKAVLESELGVPATLIAYPVGDPSAFDDRVIETARATGYQAGCSYISGTNLLAAPCRFALRRLAVERTMGLGWLHAMLTLPEWLSYPKSSHATRPVQVECSS